MLSFRSLITVKIIVLLLLILPATIFPGDSISGQIFITDKRIQKIKQNIREQSRPTYDAFIALQNYNRENRELTPSVPETWYVPGFYDDAEGHRNAKNGLRDQANGAYAFALMYRLTGVLEYAKSAINLINAWPAGLDSLSREDDSMLSFSYHFPVMIFAADLLQNRSVWAEGSQEAFKTFLREKALPMNTMDRENNWGNWGLVLASAIAAYLEDEALLDECVNRWKYFIEHQIADDGHLPHEVNRSGGMRGIWYTHFSLMPQTIAAEILRVNGSNLYEYESPSGRSLQLAFEKIVKWTSAPESFPYWDGDVSELRGVEYFSYFELLNPLWPKQYAEALLKQSRPMSANHSAPFLTLTHGNKF